MKHTVYELKFGHRTYITTQICDMVKFSLMFGEFGNVDVWENQVDHEIPLTFC